MYEGNKINLTQQFIIKENGIIKIHFPKNITTLKNFFSGHKENEPNAQNIISIDLSHFDSSSIEITEEMFYQLYQFKISRYIWN